MSVVQSAAGQFTPRLVRSYMQERSTQEIPIADIEARVREEAGDTTNELSVTPRYYCVCSGQTAEVACTSSPPAVCPPGNARPFNRYIEVDVQHSVDLLFTYPGVPDPLPLRATFTMQP